MNRTVLVAVLVAVIVAAVYFGLGTAEAHAATLPDGMPKPEPIFKPLPPGQEKVATVQTSSGPVTLVQKYDTSTFRNQIIGVTAPPVPLVKTATLKPAAAMFARRL